MRLHLVADAREHRRLARDAKRNFAGTRHELKKYVPLILGTIVAIEDSQQQLILENSFPRLEKGGWTNLVAAIRQVLAGKRDATILCEELDMEDSMIIETILHGLADPATLADLLPAKQPEAT